MTLDALVERDGAACIWCGRSPWRCDLTVEHLLPRARGGRTMPENLAVACRDCNRRRGTRPVVAYVRERRADGVEPRTDLLTACLARLAASPRRQLAAYGQRQLALLA